MDANEILKRYRLLNESFKKVLIYRCGIDTGFFTEYTRMIDAMLYCLEHKIQFRLYSDFANFGYSRKGGWTDYFLPFCQEVHETFHRKYNIYRLPSWKTILSEMVKDKNVGLLAWKLKSYVKYLMGDVCALWMYKCRVLLTRNIRLCHNPGHKYSIPELGINGDYLQAFKILYKMTWRLNDEAKDKCAALCADMALYGEYIGCQVRGGDKVTETPLISPNLYVDAIRKHEKAKDVYVLTDDYRLFCRLQQAAPEICWHTLCTPLENGYVNSNFTQTREEEKKNQMWRFLASIEILLRSSLFIGSITTGPSLFLLKVLFPTNAFPIDCPLENFRNIALLHLKKRVKISQTYLSSKN